MTPFAAKIRHLIETRGITQRDLAAALDVTPAYLSALEHGRRGRPSFSLVQKMIARFGLIWDEAEELMDLARISHPRIAIDTASLSPAATGLANRLARRIHMLDGKTIETALKVIAP